MATLSRRLPALLSTACLVVATAVGGALPAWSADSVQPGEPRRTSVPLQAAAGAASTLHTQSAPAEESRSATLTLEEGIHTVGVSWTGSEVGHASMRLLQDDGSWGPWQALELAEQATEGDVIVGAQQIQVQLTGPVEGATLQAYTTGVTEDDIATIQAMPVTGENVVVGTRADWGADESMRGTDPAALISPAPKRGVTIHHTAGTNTYTAEQVPGIIRSIFAYHGQTLNWGDIGYAMVVDKYGRAWEGRAGGIEENIQLAHAFGMNRDWVGISILGDYEAVPVPTPGVTALTAMTAWTLQNHGVGANDVVSHYNPYYEWTRQLPAIHGHLDVGITLCPGVNLYRLLGQIRAAAATAQAEGLDAAQRVSGPDRYASAAALAQEAFLEGTETAYLASGVSLVDALGVGPVAERKGAAVLLTKAEAVPEVTMQALRSLGVRNVVVVGGEGAVSPAVAAQLTAAGLDVSRVAGQNRYETAAALVGGSTMVPHDPGGDSGPVSAGGTVYLSSGESIVDALGGSAAAAERGANVLLTRRPQLTQVSGELIARLAPSRVVVLGGTAVVSDTVVDQVRTLAPGATVERIGGEDRYATSALVAQDAFLDARSAVVARGDAPADALVGTQLAARHGGPLLLVRGECRPPVVDQAFDALGIGLSRLAGGSAVLDWGAGSQVCGQG